VRLDRPIAQAFEHRIDSLCVGLVGRNVIDAKVNEDACAQRYDEREGSDEGKAGQVPLQSGPIHFPAPV
jgi:hypothetical protein